MKTGIVIKTTGSLHTVIDGNSLVQCKMKGSYRLKEVKTTNPLAVGDRVDYEPGNNGPGWITRIHQRTNYIIRRSSKLSKEAHLLAANIDQAMLVVSLIKPETPLEFIDRFLVTAEAYHIPTIIVFNKIDLYPPETLAYMHKTTNVYEAIGYLCIGTSAVEGVNLDMVKERLQGKLTLVSGNSGVGKSTLINAIQPGLNLKVKEISAYHQAGQHTTAYTEMHQLDIGGYIIDSPGIKGFGVIDFNKGEIGLFFPEIFRISDGCRYYNCTHIHEPGCAVKEAVNREEIAPWRYRSYVNIYFDENEKYRAAE